MRAPLTRGMRGLTVLTLGCALLAGCSGNGTSSPTTSTVWDGTRTDPTSCPDRTITSYWEIDNGKLLTVSARPIVVSGQPYTSIKFDDLSPVAVDQDGVARAPAALKAGTAVQVELRRSDGHVLCSVTVTPHSHPVTLSPTPTPSTGSSAPLATTPAFTPPVRKIIATASCTASSIPVGKKPPVFVGTVHITVKGYTTIVDQILVDWSANKPVRRVSLTFVYPFEANPTNTSYAPTSLTGSILTRRIATQVANPHGFLLTLFPKTGARATCPVTHLVFS